jgi:UDP-N-acetylglucosamine--N-acetylmuramyl-(pentapeptide) pyrophosphoryl-undecaprenol N-acetylglucosamine transferase
VLQTGKVDPEPYKAKHPNWTIIPYSNEFEKLVAESSIVISHQGGGTIFEAVLYGKPLIIVFNSELTRTADTEDMHVLAKKVGSPFLDHADSKTIFTLITEVEEQQKPHFENGRVKTAEIILNDLEITA